MSTVKNTTAEAIRYCFYRKDGLAFITYSIDSKSLPANYGDSSSSWFDLLPGHEARRSGPFSSTYLQPVQAPIINN